MTPERQALILDNVPSELDFTRVGPIVVVTLPPHPPMTYEKKMFLDDMVSLDKRLGTQPAPEPVRHYEVMCEGIVCRSASY